jgi:hypothetical protein
MQYFHFSGEQSQDENSSLDLKSLYLNMKLEKGLLKPFMGVLPE